jgi:hypothetical protein
MDQGELRIRETNSGKSWSTVLRRAAFFQASVRAASSVLVPDCGDEWLEIHGRHPVSSRRPPPFDCSGR